MPAANVLRLDEYRDRRHSRRELTRALHAGDDLRSRVLPHLSSIAEITGSDRAAVVWVDEFAPRLVHPWLVLDLLCDEPRRAFPLDTLERAWERGVPGSEETTEAGTSGRATSFAIALGSDGARGWFVVADSVVARRVLDEDRRGRAMFLAGECSGVVLHRDMDRSGEDGQARFPGWRYLRDLEGHETDRARSDSVSRRFLVGRLIEGLVDEGYSIAVDRAVEATEKTRLELAAFPDVPDRERELSAAVLDAFEARRLPELCAAVLEFGVQAEAVDHWQGAAAAYEASFAIAAAVGQPRVSVDSARALGRLHRRRAGWDQASAWYERALDVARAAGLGDLAARSMSGLGLVKRDVGNLPVARDRFCEALELAEGAGDRDALASIHHDLMGLEQMVGDYDRALRHGWMAARTYESPVQRTRCTASLGGVLLEVGALSEAEDAFSVVEATTEEVYYQVYAIDALAHIAAQRGDGTGYDLHTARCDALGWRTAPAYARAEIMLFRGLSCAALDRTDDARAWFREAIDYSDAQGFNRILFRAENALAALEEAVAVTPAATVRAEGAPADVRDGLRAMRRELVGAGN